MFTADRTVCCNLEEFIAILKKHLNPIFSDKPFIFMFDVCRKCDYKFKFPAAQIKDISESPQPLDSIQNSSNDIDRCCSEIVIYSTCKNMLAWPYDLPDACQKVFKTLKTNNTLHNTNINDIFDQISQEMSYQYPVIVRTLPKKVYFRPQI